MLVVVIRVFCLTSTAVSSRGLDPRFRRSGTCIPIARTIDSTTDSRKSLPEDVIDWSEANPQI